MAKIETPRPRFANRKEHVRRPLSELTRTPGRLVDLKSTLLNMIESSLAAVFLEVAVTVPLRTTLYLTLFLEYFSLFLICQFCTMD